ncbi:MAG: metallophosphoesterase [Nonomuraea sp.]|nr:metallophosphoesterase [Nonomuraea sp.]NUP64428.1 metallophosphoesterase [Nonomuraea sp.]NUP81234.1 metallophosphoesterase [Nonomuraea sp.]NUS03336.1 metallophosphoesterase [Nonomuraea sp.]NUT44106.1 metallophosphoesterase [Thermoactinospora sp.]
MVEVAAERGKQHSSRVSEAGAGWACVEPGGFAQLRPDDGGFTWLNLGTLWLSRNEILAGLFGDPSGEVRARWIAAQEARGIDPEFRIKPGVGGNFNFLILGDTGEGDASQYAVVPGMLKVGQDTSFAVIASDVIYPTGSGNEYGNKFFRPYKDYDAPIYAIPGNHDWYDGLGGFMRVFCDAPPLKPKPDRGLRGLLWRKPETIDEGRLADARKLRGRASQQAVQPAPYWAIESESLLIVGVDTGIRNVIDKAQTAWLRRVSLDPRPKILVTGKPIYTGNVYKPSRLEEGGTIDDIVRDPAHRYVAAIGGDVHNYQRYPVKVGDRVIQYIVTGGGGAFMHATHIIDRVDVGGVAEDDFKCYPLRGDSLSFYSQLYARRLRMKWLCLTPEEAVCIMSHQIGNRPARPIEGTVTVTRRMRWAARLLGSWPWPFRLPVDKVFHRFLSELSDWDSPPFFKQFLHASVTSDTLTLRCFAATGCREQELRPPLEDEVRISLS